MIPLKTQIVKAFIIQLILTAANTPLKGFVIEFSLELFVFVLSVSFTAGFMTSVAGAGALVVLPALMFIGIPPINALATTKAQGVIGVGSSAFSYFKLGYINFHRIRGALIWAFIAAALSASFIQQVNVELLEKIIPWLLIVVVLYLMLSKSNLDETVPASMSKDKANITLGTLTGFYVGMVGAGVGTLLAGAIRRCRGDTIISAIAHSKPIILMALFSGTLVFAFSGQVYWPLAIVMGVGQSIGAYVGANFSVKNGQKVLKPAIFLVTLVLSIKLLVDS